jgi:hypothetical protein
VEHSSIPHLWFPTTPVIGFVQKILPWRRGQLQRDKRIKDRVPSKIWVY